METPGGVGEGRDGTGVEDQTGQGRRRSARGCARVVTERSEREAEGRRVEQLRRRARARLGEERVEGRAAAREAGRAAVAARIEALARAGGWALEEDRQTDKGGC